MEVDVAKRPETLAQRKARIIRLRQEDRLTFPAIAARVGCTARQARHVCADAGIPYQKYGVTYGARAIRPQPLPAPAAPGPSFTHRWVVRNQESARRGHPCRLVNPSAWHQGPAALVTVEFADGHRVLAPRNAIRVIRPMPKWRVVVEARRGRKAGG